MHKYEVEIMVVHTKVKEPIHALMGLRLAGVVRNSRRPSGGKHEDVEEETIVNLQFCLPKFRSQSGQKYTGRID